MSKVRVVLLIGVLSLSPLWGQNSRLKFPSPDAELIVDDDFESYEVGTFPSSGGWYERYSGAGHNRIVDDFAHSGTKSFYIQGQYGWSAEIDNTNTLIGTSEAMSFEIYAYFPEFADALFTFNDPIPLWGFFIAPIFTFTNGYIWASDEGDLISLSPYETNNWYKFNVVADSTAGTYAIWINNVFYGDTFRLYWDGSHNWSESYFSIHERWDGHAVRVDDVKVWRGIRPPSFYIERTSPSELSVHALNDTSITFKSAAFGESGLDRAEWFINENLVYTQQLSGSIDTAEWNHDFHDFGSYEVKLKVFDATGDSAVISWEILVIEPLQTGLVAYWSFDDCTAADNSGSGHDGVIHGNPTCVPGAVGNAFHFDGEHDYIELNEFPEDFSHGITVSAWVIFEEPRHWGRIIDLGNGAESDNILFAQQNESDTLCFEVYRPGSPLNSYTQKVDVGNGIVRNQLMHVVARGTPGDDGFLHVDIFINGEKRATVNAYGEPSDITNIPRLITRTRNYIACSNWSIDELFNGLLDEIRIYNRPLTDEEIQMLYNTTDTPYRVEDLEDVNPDTSVVMLGGEFFRYYRVVDRNGEPVANATVEVTLGDVSQEFVSDASGKLTIHFTTEQLGNNVGIYRGTIFQVNGEVIPAVPFTVKVIPRKYLRKRTLGFSEGVGVSIFEISDRLQGYMGLYGTADNPDTLFPGNILSAKGEASLSWDAPVEIEVNDHRLGGNTNAHVGVGAYFENKFVFDMPDSQNATLADYALPLITAVPLPINPVLAGIIASLIRGVPDLQGWINQHYVSSETGMEIYAGGGAEFGVLGFPTATNFAVDVHGGLTSEYHVRASAINYVSGSGYSPKLELVGETESDLGLQFYNWNFANIVLPALMGIMGTNGNPVPGKFVLAIEYRPEAVGSDTSSLIVESVLKPLTDDELHTAKIIITGENSAVNELINSCRDIAGISLQSVSLILDQNSAARILYQLGDALSNQSLRNRLTITYEKHLIPFDELEGFIKVQVPLPLINSIKIGASTKIERDIITEKGILSSIEFLPLESYQDDEFVRNLDDVDSVIAHLIFQAIIHLWTEKSDSAFTYVIVNISSDTTYVDIGTAHIVIPPNALPEGSEIAVYNWSWWGSSSLTKPYDLPPDKYRILERLKRYYQQQAGLAYGIGGFYMFAPDSLSFAIPTRIEITYDDSEVVDYEEQQLALYIWDDSLKQWMYIGGTVDTASNTLTAFIDTFGIYTIAPRMPYGQFGLVPSQDTLYADGMSVCHITSTLIHNNDGTIVDDGTLFTIESTGGEIITPDADPNLDGVQVASIGDIISFDLQAPNTAWSAHILARGVDGEAWGETRVWFIDSVAPPPPDSIWFEFVDTNAVLISWTHVNVEDLSGYRLYYDTDTTDGWNGTSPYDASSPIYVGMDTFRILRLAGLQDSVYYVAVTAIDAGGNESRMSMVLPLVSVVEGMSPIPKKLEFYPPAPNPFKGNLLLRFALPRRSMVRIKAYDISGRLVKIIYEGEKGAGVYTISWDRRDHTNHRVPRGIYFIKFEAGNYSRTYKVVAF